MDSNLKSHALTIFLALAIITKGYPDRLQKEWEYNLEPDTTLDILETQRNPRKFQERVPEPEGERPSVILHRLWPQVEFKLDPAPLISVPMATFHKPSAPLISTEVLPEEEPVVKPPRIKKKHTINRASNVCTRHNMRKVYTNGGRSWRCLK